MEPSDCHGAPNRDHRITHAVILQWDVACLQPERNIEWAQSLLKDAQPLPGDIVILPELWPTSYGSRQQLKHLVRERSTIWNGFLSDAARTFEVYFVGGTVPDLVDESLVNRLVVYAPSGEQIVAYDKIHLFPPLQEDELFKPGGGAEPIALENSPFVLGPVICYDVRFPELFRLLAVHGANIFVLPAEFPDPREDLWHTFLAARAAENQAFLVACNRIGKLEPFTFFGSSAVYDPEGQCLGRLGREAGYLSVPLDATRIEQTRRRLRVLEQTRIVCTIPK